MIALVFPLLLSMLWPPIGTSAGPVLARRGVRASYRPSVHRLAEEPTVPAPAGRPARGRFLVASRQLTEPTFAETVILLVEHGDQGAMGVVLNRPTHIPLATALQGLEEGKNRKDMVLWGGPVAMTRVMTIVRAATPPAGSHPVFADVYVTASRAVLRQALGHKGKDNRFRAFAGHAGWGPGQLENEIARGDWLIVTGDPAFVFDRAAETMWPALIQRVSGEWADRGVPAVRPFMLAGRTIAAVTP